MKKISLLAVALTPFIGASVLSATEHDVATDPVGYVKLDLQPGLQAVGASLVNPAVAAGTVASNNGSSITLDGDHGLDLGAGHYVEVAGDGGLAGDRFEVASASGNTISIDTASANTTVDLGAIDLTGERVLVRPHVTLSQAFPVDEVNEGDQILIFNPDTGGFDTYTLEFFVFADEYQWRRGGANQNAHPIHPGKGALYRNVGNAVELFSVMGEVRTNYFSQPLDTGLNNVAEGHPVDNSPASRGMADPDEFDEGDQILVFNPATGGFDTYTYEFFVFADEYQWRRGGADHTNSEIFQADKSVLVRKVSAANPEYQAPKTF